MRIAGVLLLIAAITGLLSHEPIPQVPETIGEYRVLSGDFHLHMFPLDASTLAPWDVVLEARRRGLDVIALTGHNQAVTAKTGRWFSNLVGGPIVLVGEEIITAPYDMIAVGVSANVDWHGSAAESVARIHEQGGVAIAPHPLRVHWPSFDEAAMRDLDGAEVLHPMAYTSEEAYAELREFFARKPMAAIGSSDFHGTAFPGFSRTYVFVREATAEGVMEALRAHRTVAVDRDGQAYGDAEMIRLAEGALPPTGRIPESDVWSVASRIAAIAAMLLVTLVGFRSQ